MSAVPSDAPKPGSGAGVGADPVDARPPEGRAVTGWRAEVLVALVMVALCTLFVGIRLGNHDNDPTVFILAGEEVTDPAVNPDLFIAARAITVLTRGLPSVRVPVLSKATTFRPAACSRWTPPLKSTPRRAPLPMAERIEAGVLITSAHGEATTISVIVR